VGEQFGGKAGVITYQLDRLADFRTAFVQAASDFFAHHFRKTLFLRLQTVGKFLQTRGTFGYAQLRERPAAHFQIRQPPFKLRIILSWTAVKRFARKYIDTVKHRINLPVAGISFSVPTQ
ncbi:hypothetical protein, partial [Neisseria meningitidis serogroup B]